MTRNPDAAIVAAMTYETHVHYIPTDGADTVARFDNQTDAWRFMRLCDEIGVPVGYPSLGKATECCACIR